MRKPLVQNPDKFHQTQHQQFNVCQHILKSYLHLKKQNVTQQLIGDRLLEFAFVGILTLFRAMEFKIDYEKH